jgi:hypothetical protein
MFLHYVYEYISIYLQKKNILHIQVGGYSAVLPYGNEDYDFWLKLMEIGIKPKKLTEPGIFLSVSMYTYI